MGLILRPTPGTRTTFFSAWAIPIDSDDAKRVIKSKAGVVLALVAETTPSEALVALTSAKEVDEYTKRDSVSFGMIDLVSLADFNVGWTKEELLEKLG